ncbi:MAG: complex I subunit 1 family protein [Bdellovibrionota bacterium]
MGKDILEITINLVKVAVIFLMMVQMVPLLVWLERRGSAFIQNRLGPNRVGPLGLMQLLADAVKFIFKEQFIPGNAVKFLFLAAPVIALVPAALAFAAIPLSTAINIDAFQAMGQTWGPYVINMQSVKMEVGIIYILAVSSLGAYGLLIAGWGSGNKYSLLGALRASAQMISYELALGLSIVGILMIYGTFDLNKMIDMQAGPLSFVFMGKEFIAPSFVPNWGIFFQPIGALLFFIAAFAESNRLPFDLPESEGELVAGFHTEYGGFKMLLFFMGEYGHMMVSSGLVAVFYLGGYHIPGITPQMVNEFFTANVAGGTVASVLTSLIFLGCFVTKVAILLWIFIWVRWTLPRFRYDTLMDLGWRTLLPWTLGNAIITAIVLYFAKS